MTVRWSESRSDRELSSLPLRQTDKQLNSKYKVSAGFSMKAGCPRPTAPLIRPLTALVFEFRGSTPLFRAQPPIQAPSAAAYGKGY